MVEFEDDNDYTADTECEKCGKDYDEIDYEFQSCSKCGWNASSGTWSKSRVPTDKEYLNGEANILTQEFN